MEPLVQVKNIQKAFAGVLALNDISVDFYPGRVHVLLGENGAGKSTLIKIISGVYQKDEGHLYLEGREINPHNAKEGIDIGISVIHQELSVIPDLSVAENIFLDRLSKSGVTFVHFDRLYKDTRRLMDRLRIQDIRPQEKVCNLSAANRQMVEIMRAISRNAKMVVMDEPTSSLSDQEVDMLFEVIDRLKKQNVAIVYITHKLKEIFAVGDDISIFKDGALVCTRQVKGLDETTMVSMMVGRDIGDYYIRSQPPEKKIPVLKVKNLCGSKFHNVSFTLYQGEVLGFAGLVGAGRTELMRAIFGADRYFSGEIYVDGKKCVFTHPRDAVARGIALVPEDRRKQGVFLDVSVRDNISSVSLRHRAKGGFINFPEERRISAEYLKKLRIKTPSDQEFVRYLSGGNQQKVVLAKWLAEKSRILILDEPTRGIDVNAKAEIYKLICEYIREGGSVVMVSSELPEVVGISQRIVVMHAGRITAVVEGERMTEETIMYYATLDEDTARGDIIE